MTSTNGSRPAAPPVVAAVVSQDLLTFDFAIACEVFGLDRSDIVDPWYDFRVVSSDRGPLRTSTGFSIDGVRPLSDAAEAGTVIVPGWADPDRLPDAATVNFMRERHAAGARIVSFCTGTFALAATGLLDGRRATTHWMYADKLASMYPGVSLDPSVLYLEDSNIFTAAGTAAGMDLSLHLVSLDHGQGVANAAARRIIMPPMRAGGQAQYIEYSIPTTRRPVAALLEWIEGHLGEPLTLGQLADQAHMSVRSLTRHFNEEVGMSPMAWLNNRRLVLAREMFESTDLPVETVAAHCGFSNAAALRGHFRKVFMTTPSAYREMFGSH